MRLTIFRPSSRESEDYLTSAIAALKAEGFSVDYRDVASNPDWSYSAGTAKDRAEILNQILQEPEAGIVLAARGGYGASDLLPYIAFETLRQSPQKWVSGFSDVSALHSAFYTKLGWRGIHGAMPATKLWQQGPDIEALCNLWRAVDQRSPAAGSLKLKKVGDQTEELPIKGELFGGCFTVLTNLIGTPYIPKSLTGKILFFEDIGEHPARLMRAWNQWLQSGLTEGVRGVIFGSLRDLGANIPEHADFVYEELSRRCDIPFYRTEDFGHLSPNYPLVVGAMGELNGSTLQWQISFEQQAAEPLSEGVS